MTFLREYILRLICCAVLCNIVLMFLRDGTVKTIVRMVAGIYLTMTAISPLKACSIPDMDLMDSEYYSLGQMAADSGVSYAEENWKEFIKASVESYILDKASNLGCDIEAAVKLDEEGCPVGVILSGVVSSDIQKELENIITEELGIPKEDQQWSG